jgi:hypothetical protein
MLLKGIITAQWIRFIRMRRECQSRCPFVAVSVVALASYVAA